MWPGWGGIEYLDKVNAYLRQHNRKVLFVDGNHEWFDQLDYFDSKSPKSSDGHVYIRSNILHIPRGRRWTWDKKNFMGVGGAVSIDKEYRTLGQSWWTQEALTENQAGGIAESASKRPPVDYLFTHDSPQCVPMNNMKVDPDSCIHRGYMDKIGAGARPKIWAHGHYHKKMEYTFGDYIPDFTPTRVYGLDMDGTNGNLGLLDTADDSFRWVSGL